MRNFSVLAVSLLFAGGLQAQVTLVDTFPTGFLKTEGPSSHHPGWRYTNARTLTLFNSKNLSSTIKVVRGLKARPTATTSNMIKKTVTVEVAMSSKGVITIEPYYSDWSKHFGTDRMVVLKRKSFIFPAVTGSSTPGPRAWAMDFKFDVPWVRLSTNICVDMKFWTPSTAMDYWYADASYTSKYGFYQRIGVGCPTTAYHYASGGYVGYSTGWYTYGYTRAVGDTVLNFIGSKLLPSPVKVGSVGTDPCMLQVLPEFIHPSAIVTTLSTGRAYRFIWGPVTTPLVGLSVFSQLAAIPKGTIKLKMTNAIKYTFGGGTAAKYNQASLYGYARGTAAFDPDKDLAKYYSTATAIFGVY